MGRFARDAPWLRKMFPSSGTPATAQPSAVSEDIQLSQDYLAAGQVQNPSAWVVRQVVQNPGNGNTRTVLSPISSTLEGPEVWRIYYMSVTAITPGPTTPLSFDIHADFPATGLDVMLFRDVSILAGILQPSRIPLDAPLLLASDQTSNVGINLSVNLLMKQIAGSPAADVLLQFDYYILRNQKGVAHYL